MKLKDENTGSDTSPEKPAKKKRKDRRVEKEFYEWVEVKDPATGEMIRQRVKVTRYKAKGGKPLVDRPTISEEELGFVEDE